VIIGQKNDLKPSLNKGERKFTEKLEFLSLEN